MCCRVKDRIGYIIIGLNDNCWLCLIVLLFIFVIERTLKGALFLSTLCSSLSYLISMFITIRLPRQDKPSPSLTPYWLSGNAISFLLSVYSSVQFCPWVWCLFYSVANATTTDLALAVIRRQTTDNVQLHMSSAALCCAGWVGERKQIDKLLYSYVPSVS